GAVCHNWTQLAPRSRRFAEVLERRTVKPAPSKFKLGLIQVSCGVSVEENLQKALFLIRQGVQRGAQIICLQELFRSQYFCQKQEASIFDLAEPIPGPSTEALA